VRKINDHVIEIETKAPFPILPDACPRCYIMSKKWCETNQATRPVDRRKGIENAASFRANGTGPYRLRERQPNVRTTFVRNGNTGARSKATSTKSSSRPSATMPRVWPRCCPARSTSWSPCRCRTSIASMHRQCESAGRPGAAHHLPGHGPEA
jgi:hypothetical protein